MVLEACRGRISKFTGRPIVVLAAGGIYNSMGVAASLAMGADGVWCGTKFVAATESGASDGHQRDLLDTDVSGTTKTIIYTVSHD
jgi:NAD(P)H-dependent flavin oxidoreductase YrpB (nitropropane dioxygenase family)